MGIFTTDSDSVPDLQQIYNRILIDHRFKIGCNSVNDNFGQEPIYNRIFVSELIHRLKFGSDFKKSDSEIILNYHTTDCESVIGFTL